LSGINYDHYITGVFPQQHPYHRDARSVNPGFAVGHDVDEDTLTLRERLINERLSRSIEVIWFANATVSVAK
jgi:hypothetical protein